MNLLGSDVLVVLILLGAATVLAAPGLLAYRRALKEDESVVLRVQIDKLAQEVQRLQVLVDDQARQIGSLQVETANLRMTQKVLIENMKRLAGQIKQAGHEPIVDVEALVKLLP